MARVNLCFVFAVHSVTILTLAYQFSEPSGAPINIQVRVLSSSSVEVQWEPPSFIHHNGLISGYWVEVTDWRAPPRLVFNETTEKLSMVIEGIS